MGRLLDAAELGRYLGDFRQRLFRMETLPAYTVDSDGDDYQRWLAGSQSPRGSGRPVGWTCYAESAPQGK